MPVMVPLTSDLNETPSSSAPLAPLSMEAGTVVAGQIVCCAAAWRQQAGANKRHSTAVPAYFSNLKTGCIAQLCILVFKKISPICSSRASRGRRTDRAGGLGTLTQFGGGGF